MKRLFTALLVLAVPALSGAHPLGNFTTNRYAALTVEPQAVRVAYVVDLAELPAYREIELVDTDGSGTIDSAGAVSVGFGEREIDDLLHRLAVICGRAWQGPRMDHADHHLAPGEQRLDRVRFRAKYEFRHHER